jgi:hypothetical protein
VWSDVLSTQGMRFGSKSRLPKTTHSSCEYRGMATVTIEILVQVPCGGERSVSKRAANQVNELMMTLGDLLPEYAEVTTRSMRWQGEEIGLTDLQVGYGSRIGVVFQAPMIALNPLMVAGEQIAECLRKEGAGCDIVKDFQ